MPKPNETAVVVLTRLFPNIVQTYVLNHITALIDAGINTSIIADSNPEQAETNPAIEEYGLLDKTTYITDSVSAISRLFTDCKYFFLISKIATSKIWLDYGIKYTFLSFARVLAIPHKSCNLIHSHSLFSSFKFLFARKYLSIPLITTYHGMVPRGVNKLSTEKMKSVIAATDIFIVNTEFAKSELVGLGCVDNKIRIIPQGTDSSKFRYSVRKIQPGKPIKLLTIARLSPEKGHVTAIHAIKHLIDEFPDIEYHIVGHGPEKENLYKLTEHLQLQNHVILHDFMTGDALLNMFSEAHIFILPSINFQDGFLVETQGVVLQEAQASGTPVIGSNAGGIPDVIIDNKTGLVFEQKNHEQLAEKIRLLIKDKLLYEELCRAGRNDVEQHFDTTVVYRRLITIYQEILGSRPLH